MFNRFATSLTLMLAGAAMAMAAAPRGAVVSVKENVIVIKIEGEKAAWIKKGATVKINNKINGKITEATDAIISVTSKKAGELKAGEAITIDKSLAASGC